MRARTVKAWFALVGIGLIAVVLAGAVASVIARRLTAPIDRLTDTARRIGEGDLGSFAAPSGVPEIDVLATTLNASARQIASMIDRERRLSAEVSHQLRTPLTGLRLELETARASDAGFATNLDRALATLDRLDDTITEVITLTRDLPGGQTVVLDDVLSDVQRRWHGVLAAVNRPLRVARGDAGTASMSPAAAGQIIDVLVDNARAHGRGTVTIATRRLDGAVAVDVCDEGAKLVAEPHELFRRHPGSDGHGIGLPFARRLAEHEGARLVVSRPDPPTFSLIIPVDPSGSTDRAS